MFVDAFRSVIRTWKHHFFSQFTTLLVMIGSFSTLLCFLLVAANLKIILIAWADELQMSVYLEEKISEDLIASIESYIKSNDKIKSFTFVSNEEAQLRFQKQMSTIAPDLSSDQEILGLVPASFDIVVKTEFLRQMGESVLLSLSEEFKKLHGVSDTTYGQGWISRYQRFVTGVNSVGLVLGLILSMACIILLAFSIRISLYQRRQEIEILELIGATVARIRMPFVFEGIFLALLSTTLSCALVGLVSYILYNSFLPTLSLLGLDSMLKFLPLGVLVLFVFIGTVLGGLTSYLILLRMNTGWSASRVDN